MATLHFNSTFRFAGQVAPCGRNTRCAVYPGESGRARLAARTRRVVKTVEEFQPSAVNLGPVARSERMPIDNLVRLDRAPDVIVANGELHVLQAQDAKLYVAGERQSKLAHGKRNCSMGLRVKGLLGDECRNKRNWHPVRAATAFTHYHRIAGKPQLAVRK